MSARVAAIALLAAGALLALLLLARTPGSRSERAVADPARDPVQAEVSFDDLDASAPVPRSSRAAAVVADRVGIAAAANPALVPLPAPNTRVADVYDDLARRARAGDTRASCRLAAELARCAQLPMLRLQLRHSEARTLDGTKQPGSPEKHRIDTVARLGNTVDAIGALCEGTGPERANEAFDWLLRAAAGGHVPAMSRFVREPMLSPQRYLHELDRLAAYRERAAAFALAALEAGDPEILPALAMAWAPKEVAFDMLSQVMPVDLVRARAASRTYQMVRNLAAPKPGVRRYDPLDGTMVALSPEQEAQAEALAAEWFSRWYGGQPRPARPYVASERDDFSWCENDR